MRVIRPIAGLVVATLALVSAETFAKPGDGYLWEYTSTMDMEGMQMKMPPTQHCQPIVEAPKTPPMEGDCKMDKLETVGNTTTFEMSCGSPRDMKGSGTSTVTETTLEGTYTMVSDDGEMKMHILGARKGTCDTAAPPPMMKGMPAMPPGMMPPGAMPPS